MKLDAHVHTHYSGRSTIGPLKALMRESYNTPEAVYRRAKARGMDLVAITDHDRIDGALTLADRPDVIVGCEVTATFPHDGVRVHLNVLDLSEAEFREIDRLRGDITELMPYLKARRLFTSLNHVASRVNARVRSHHVAALMPWVDGIEVINGSRLRRQNRTADWLARGHGKVPVAGSDAHTYRGIGHTWIDAPHATTRNEFMTDLHAGRVVVGGRHGSVFTMSSDVMRMTAGIYEEHGRALVAAPWRWRRQVMGLCLAIGAPLVLVPLVAGALHFVLEARFNQMLLKDLSRQAAGRVPELA
jgi:predicted metal-dependent phosphoesterase TrpH